MKRKNEEKSHSGRFYGNIVDEILNFMLYNVVTQIQRIVSTITVELDRGFQG